MQCDRMRYGASLLFRRHDPYLTEFFSRLCKAYKTAGIYAVIICNQYLSHIFFPPGLSFKKLNPVILCQMLNDIIIYETLNIYNPSYKKRCKKTPRISDIRHPGQIQAYQNIVFKDRDRSARSHPRTIYPSPIYPGPYTYSFRPRDP